MTPVSYTHLAVAGGLLNGVDQLAQVLNGINIVMGSGRDGIGALRHHPGAGDVSHNLGTGEVSADAGLGALAHFDLDGSTGVKVVLVDAEAAGGHLHHRIGTVPVEVLMQAAFPAVVADSQFLGGLGHKSGKEPSIEIALFRFTCSTRKLASGCLCAEMANSGQLSAVGRGQRHRGESVPPRSAVEDRRRYTHPPIWISWMRLDYDRV